MNVKHKLLAAVSILLVTACTSGSYEIHVSPEGNDQNEGSIDSPLATITAARDMIRGMEECERNRNINIYLRGGEYNLSETVKFSLEDSAPDGYTYSYTAYENEIPVVSSDVKVTGWESAKTLPSSLIDARGEIFVAPIPQGIERVYVMYCGEKRVQRSHKEGFEIEMIKPIALEEHAKYKEGSTKEYYIASRSMNVYHEKDRYLLKEFRFNDPNGVLKEWDNIEEVEVGFAPVPWALNIIPLSKVDRKNNIAYTSIEANAPAGSKPSHTAPFVENVLEYLEKGEFATYKGNIYFWATNTSQLNNTTVPKLMEYILVEGEIDYMGAKDTPVKNLAFNGITFTRGARDSWDGDHKGWGIQHDWDRFDYGNAMLRFRGAESCVVDGCRFTNSANSAIRLDLHAQNITIKNNLIDYVGHMGIFLCGYGPGTKDVNRGNTITNNLIHHVGEVIKHGAGIFMWQSGENVVSHNRIHHVPRKGVGICGVRTPIMVKDWCDFDEASKTIRRHEIDSAPLNDYKAGKITIGEYWRTTLPYLHARNNIVEYNEVYRALEALGDGSVLNVSGAGEGNIVRNNYVHHIASKASGVLRTDDWQRGTLFEKNIIYFSNIAAIVHKGYNHIENNLIVDCSIAESIRWASYPDEEEDYGSRVTNNIFYESGDRINYYRESYRASEGISLPHNSATDSNLFWCAGGGVDAQSHIDNWRKRGIESKSIAVDPLIEDVASANFALPSDSPASTIGFEPIDLLSIDLIDEFPARYLEFDYKQEDDNSIFHRQRNKRDIYDFW